MAEETPVDPFPVVEEFSEEPCPRLERSLIPDPAVSRHSFQVLEQILSQALHEKIPLIENFL
jgi:hypothetical protein